MPAFIKTFLLAVQIAAVSLAVHSATIIHKTIDDEILSIGIDGIISPSDVGAVEKLLNAHAKYNVRVYLSSDGGEIESAMAIGRLLRRRDATVIVSDKCLSSCVLIYSSGVERLNNAEALTGTMRNSINTGIGIHRFYFSHVSPNATTSQIATARNRQKDRIRDYLSEVNVSHQIIDAMEATPPEQMRILKLSELYQFGLGRVDPVFDERRTALQASYFKLNSAEYRKRSAAAKAYCNNPARYRKCSNQNDTCNFDFDALVNCESDFIRAGGR